MDDLRQRLDVVAGRFVPAPDAFRRVSERAAHRQRRRRVTSGAAALVIAVAVLGSLWSVTRGHPDPAVTVGPAPSPSATSASTGALRITANAMVDGWIPLDDGSHVWVAGPGTLSVFEPATGDATIVARGAWDYDYTDLAAYGEGTIWLASGSTLWAIAGDGTTIATRDLGLGEISAVLQAGNGTWVAATGPDGGTLARIDLYTGDVLEHHRLGQGVYELAETAGYLFVSTRASRGPSIWRLDLRTHDFVPLPGSTPGYSIATVGTTLWVTAEHAIHCIDARRLIPCGDVYLPAPVAVASDGRNLWVLTATGSTSATLYLPDPKHPATVMLLDGATGDLLAGPVALPDTTPARITAFDGHAWVGFYDSGRLVRIDVCRTPGCRAARG
jgi:hypothetical protein